MMMVLTSTHESGFYKKGITFSILQILVSLAGAVSSLLSEIGQHLLCFRQVEKGEGLAEV